jgi:hypothetical protein
VYHRDIAPDNILLLPDGQPVILDFGSARRVIGDRTQSLTAILKPNYSPVEQYADDAGMRQGGYTDLYALGGTVYFMLCGKEPIPAVMRAVRDSFPLLALSPAEPFQHVSSEFLAAIDWALGVSPDDRPQTVADLRLVLRGDKPAPAPSERHGVLISDPTQAYDASRAMARTEIAARPAGAGPVPEVEVGAPVVEASGTTGVAHPEVVAALTTVRSRRPRAAWLVMSGLGVSACAGLLWALLGTPQSSSAQVQAAVAVPVVSAGAAAAVAVLAPTQARLAPPEPIAAPLPSSAPTPQASARADERRSTRAAPAPAPSASRAPLHPPVIAAVASAAPRPVPSKAPEVPAAVPDTSSAPCPDMNFFARAACLNRSCETPRWKSHPHCVEARRFAEQRQQRMEH